MISAYHRYAHMVLIFPQFIAKFSTGNNHKTIDYLPVYIIPDNNKLLSTQVSYEYGDVLYGTNWSVHIFARKADKNLYLKRER